MDENQIRELISTGRRELRTGWFCPNDNELAAYVTGQLDERKRKSLDEHAANCEACAATLAFLVKSSEWPDVGEVPAAALYRVRNLASDHSGAVWNWRWAIASAAAACLILVVALIALQFRARSSATSPGRDLVAQQHQPETPVNHETPRAVVPQPVSIPSNHKPKEPEVVKPLVRGPAQFVQPALLFPREGAVLKPEQVRFSWKPVSMAALYEVNVVTEDGSFVAAPKTNETNIKLSGDAVSPGKKYFVTVVAHLNDGRTIKSEIVSFRIAAR
jgi:hypothetical protein